MDRRLRLALLIGVFVLALLPNFGTPAVASPRASGRVVANEVTQAWPGHNTANLTVPDGSQILSANAGSTGFGEATVVFTSDVLDAGQRFDRLGIHWLPAANAGETLYVDARTSRDGVTWSDWQIANEDFDLDNPDTNERYGAPIAIDGGARYAQYRIFMTNGDPDAVSRVGLTFMDVSDLNASPTARLFNDIAGAFTDWTRSYADAATGTPKILTRQDWGADESLMQWAPRYQKVQKFVIHHTVTDDGGTNVAATIRGIYYYHAVTRGWGDIGYNYLVDKFGNIWTGRQGGDNTIAGHAYGWNNGTIGIAAIGDYSINPPTGALQGALTNLIALKAQQFGIQPYGNDTFTHQEQSSDGTWVNVTNNPPNVMGHRDANYILDAHGGQTACPGNGIYNMIDGLRRQAQTAVTAGYYVLPFIEPQLPKAAYPGAALNVPVTVTNRGVTSIAAGTAVSYKVLAKGAVAIPQGGQATITSPLAPGQSAVVNVPFATPAIGSYVVRWDLQTGGAWWNAINNTPVRDMWFNSADWSVDWVKDNVPIAWVAGETKQITVTVQNDGGRAWPAGGANPVQLGYKWVSSSTGNTFPGAARVSLPQDVPPGGTVTLTIPMTAPTYPTSYTNYLDLYKLNEFAFSDKGVAPDDTPTGVSIDFKATYLIGGQPAFTAGQTTAVPVLITNAGKGVLPVTNSYPVDLGYHWYTSAGATVLWDGARTKFPADLQPGQSVQVQAQVSAPTNAGAYQLRFDLVQEGVAWFSQKALPTGNLNVNIAGPVIPSFGAGYEPAAAAPGMAGTQTTIPITVRNTSNFAWPAGGANPVTLSYHWSTPAGQTVVWDGLRTKLPVDVPAGNAVQLQANVAYPAAAGSYVLRWDMVQEGVTWFSGKGVSPLTQNVTVNPNVPPFYGGSMDVSATPVTLAATAPQFFTIRVQNLSNFAWGANVNLSYHWYDASGNVVVWDGLRTSVAGINVNEVRSLTVKVAPPSAPGTYTLRYDIVQEGVAWFSGSGMQTPARAVAVAVGKYAAVYTPGTTTLSAAVNTMPTVSVAITNVGSLTWQPGEVNVAYHLFTPAGNTYVWDGVRTPLPSAVAPGQTVTVNVAIKMPASPAAYEIRVDLVQEGVTWFSGQSIAPASISLQVQ